MSGAPLLEARTVTVEFASRRGTVTALHDLSTEVAPGEFVCLLGASGCGKSTLLNLFAGFLRPTAGEVLHRGIPVSGIDPRLSMIFQSYALFPWLTVAENIGFGPRMRGCSDPERVRDLIRRVGIEGFDDHYPAQLSGGMKQRVALARTLANDPEVLLCDEPFAALDAMTRQVMQEELSRIVGEEGRTCVFVTHSIEESLILADRIVLLSARPGRVKEVIRNDLPRPRTEEVRTGDEFLDRKRRIWESVQQEVLAGMKEA